MQKIQINHTSWFYRALLILFLLGSVLFPPLFFTVIALMSITIFVMSNIFSYSALNLRFVLKVTAPFLLIAMIGLWGVLDHQYYDVFKDVWYVMNPVVMVFFGFLLASRFKSTEAFFSTIIAVGFIVSIFHISRFLLDPSLIMLSATEIRKVAGGGSTVTLIALALILINIKFKLQLLFQNKLCNSFIVMVIVLSIMLYFSRAIFLSIMVIIFLVLGWEFLKKGFNLAVIVIFASVILVSILYFVPEVSIRGTGFFEKLVYSLNELRLEDYTSAYQINNNWRGFESYQAYKQFLSGSWFEIIFGQGFGQSVDLQMYMRLDNEYVRFINVLHNGYLFALIKTGVIGLFLYLTFLILFLRQVLSKARMTDLDQFLSILATFIVVKVLLDTYIISGLYNKGSFQLSLLIGAVLYFSSDFSLHKKRSANGL